MQQNDPTELLEVFTAAGAPTGQAKPRAAVHLAGDWHQAFHCWILRPNGDVVLQRRSFQKDTFAGCWDASAAGHWRFGETMQQAAREINEELGITVDPQQLRFRGRERQSRRFSNGLIDREHHLVYVLASSLPLDAFRPDPREVIGLGEFPLRALMRLRLGRVPTVRATAAVRVDDAGRLQPAEVVLGRDDLVPYSAARLGRLLLGNTGPVATI